MKRYIIPALISLGFSNVAFAGSDVICSYAPSQSANVASISALAGGAAATAAAVAQTVGLTAVLHSSGAYILTGSAGYVAGTLGGAVTGPAIVMVGLVIGGTAVTVELLCVPRNHPEQVKRISAAADEFSRRTNEFFYKTKASINEATVATRMSIGETSANASPTVKRASVTVKQVAGNVYDYAYRKSQDAKQWLPK